MGDDVTLQILNYMFLWILEIELTIQNVFRFYQLILVLYKHIWVFRWTGDMISHTNKRKCIIKRCGFSIGWVIVSFFKEFWSQLLWYCDTNEFVRFAVAFFAEIHHFPLDSKLWWGNFLFHVLFYVYSLKLIMVYLY